ncbi:MAG: GNAT family N-acetyltransferase [Desulfobacterales bacterium]|nr:GNAT family N-acetyltransferase [Desulfobacterales bacterium]
MSEPVALNLRWVNRIKSIDEAAWNALAASLPTPFFEWEWLRLLEESGSAVETNGWQPHHLTVWRADRLIAAAPLYIKSHSAGEFVFDHVWADVAQRLELHYYPKLVGMSPFSPTIGYRFLIAVGEDETALSKAMLRAIDTFCRRYGLSGCSFNYVDPDWAPVLAADGFLSWTHQSYAWINRDYRSFDDYLAIFKSGQRRNIKRERKAMARQSIRLVPLSGAQITTDLFRHMYALYSDTNAQFGPWGCHYLTDAFFKGLHARYRHRILLMGAFQDGRKLPIGMSFLLYKGDRLYGRYWGATTEAHALHFNACYYAPIEWAIANGIRRFDPGIGGHHKTRRGFEAVPNYSYHRFYEWRLQEILRLNIGKINQMEMAQIRDLNRELPLANREFR